MSNFNTGATATAVTAASVGITIPSGVLTNDVMVMLVQCFTEDSTQPTISISGGGGSWTLAPVGTGNNPALAQNGTIFSYGFLYYRVATSGDPGAALTITETGSAAATTWFAVALGAYTGFYTTAPIGHAGSASSLTNTVQCPAQTTTSANSWAVYAGGGGVNGSGTVGGGPSGATSREAVSSSAGIGASLFDSNASVGAVGASFGGTASFDFTTSDGAAGFLDGFSIELRTQAPPAVTPPAPTPPRIPHSLWFKLLEIAQSRADWQAQGVASLSPFTWRLMDGGPGRPGPGSSGTQPPAAGTSNASAVVNGQSFYVTQGGMWFQGYWYYCCASGQSTAPQKFCLWSVTNGGGVVVPGSVVTSGTLTAGQFNYIPLPQPIQIAIWGIYTPAVGVPAGAGFPDTTAQFGSGNPYAGGIVNGPLVAFSDTAGSNPAPYSLGQGSTVAGTDPTVSQPFSGSGTHDNFWLDVQVTNVQPPGYNGTHRAWPNMADADFATAADAAVAYVIGTEERISTACQCTAIWYYVAAGQGAVTNQWATSADIWRVRDGAHMATVSNPTWLRQFTNQPDVTPSNSGRWVYCQLSGVILPPDKYYVTVYNGNGSPNAWGAKRLGYWAQFGNPGASTYQSLPPGVNGITDGPLYVPPTPLASETFNFNNNPAGSPPYSDGTVLTGQSVFAVGPPNQVPYLYVGNQSSGGATTPALFQNYWVMGEWQPVSSLPEAPSPPRIPHPLWTRNLLELAAERLLSGTAPVSAAPTSGTATMAAASNLTALVTLLAPATMAAQSALSALVLQSAGVTMAAQTGLAANADQSAPVTLAVAAGLSALGDAAAVATLGAAAAIVNVAELSAPATMAAQTGLTAPSVAGATVTMVAAAVLTSLGDQLATVTMAAASALLSGAQAGTGSMGAGSSLAVLGDLAAPAVFALASQLVNSGSVTSAPVALAAAAGVVMASLQKALVTMAAVSLLTAIGGSPPPPVQPGGGNATVGPGSESSATVTGLGSAATVTARAFIASVGAGSESGATVTGPGGQAKVTKGWPH